jgi:pyrroline-5-carboxylate reductase
MAIDGVADRGLGLLGCGKMGSALLQGWLDRGVDAKDVWVLEPNPSDWLSSTGVHVNEGMPSNPAMVVVAVKPQMMGEALPVLAPLGQGETVFLSIAAGTQISGFEAVLGAETPVIRAMPNTPAAVGKGMSAIIGNSRVSERQLVMAEQLLSAVGQVVRLDAESQMDAVTAVSRRWRLPVKPKVCQPICRCVWPWRRLPGQGRWQSWQMRDRTNCASMSQAPAAPRLRHCLF